MESRVETTRRMGEAILECRKPPRLWINSSTATIYRHSEDRPMTEETGEFGSGFSVNVARDWEKAFFDFRLPETRQIALRMAIVLGRGGGALKPVKTLAKMGLGGKQGNGKQMFSWIHIEDIFRIISFLESKEEMEGVFNCAAPEPVTNEVFMKTVRRSLHVNLGLPSPKWLLEMGAVFIRTETELILKSRWVLPVRLLKAGYKFQYPELPGALDEALS